MQPSAGVSVRAEGLFGIMIITAEASVAATDIAGAMLLATI